MKSVLVVLVTALSLVVSALPQEAERADKTEARHPTKQLLRVRVSRSFAEGLMIKKVAPEYPSKALEQRIQGDVVLKVLIDVQGIVTEASYVSGHTALKEAAIEAAKKYRFHTYLVNGEPAEMETQLVIQFRLAPGSDSKKLNDW